MSVDINSHARETSPFERNETGCSGAVPAIWRDSLTGDLIVNVTALGLEPTERGRGPARSAPRSADVVDLASPEQPSIAASSTPNADAELRDAAALAAFPDSEGRRAWLDELSASLTPEELRLLEALSRCPDRVLGRHHLSRSTPSVHGASAPGGRRSRSVDTLVQRVRRKLPDVGRNIVTVRGAGYRFSPASTPSREPSIPAVAVPSTTDPRNEAVGEPWDSASSSGARDAALSFGPLSVRRLAHRALVAGRDARLTEREFRLLMVLLERRDRLQTRAELMRLLWKEGGLECYPRSVDVAVCRLRAKLGEAGRFIETVRGAGYRFVGEPFSGLGGQDER